MGQIQISPKRAEAARYRKIAAELDAAALVEETKQLEEAQKEAQQAVEQIQEAAQQGTTPAPTTQSAPDSTGSGILDQILGHGGY